MPFLRLKPLTPRAIVALLVGWAMLTLPVAPVGAQELECDGSPATLIGTEGDDVLVGTDEYDVILGLGGNDIIRGGDGFNIICAGDGDDVVYGGATAHIYGGPGNDKLVGGALADRLYGEEGDDDIRGGGGEDRILGQSGDDILRGGKDNDLILAGAGKNRTYGGKGNDMIFGGGGRDFISGGPDSDDMYGGAGNDTIRGGTDLDALYGGDGNDILNGGAGNDYLRGDEGDDELVGRSGPDDLLGGSGADQLRGGPGADLLIGGLGADVVIGGSEVDRCDQDGPETATSCETIEKLSYRMVQVHATGGGVDPTETGYGDAFFDGATASVATELFGEDFVLGSQRITSDTFEIEIPAAGTITLLKPYPGYSSSASGQVSFDANTRPPIEMDFLCCRGGASAISDPSTLRTNELFDPVAYGEQVSADSASAEMSE